MYTQTNNVNIKPKSYLPEFHVSQNDVGRTLTAHLVSDEGDISIPIGATVTMAGTKPSGLGYTVTGTIDGSDVSFDTDAVMTDEPGRIVSEIRIVQGDTVIGTTNVVLSVEPNPHPDDTTDGQREPLINEITALLHAIEEQAEQVADNARAAEQAMDAWTNMTAEAETLPAGSEASALYGNGVLLLGIPAGPEGTPGQDGQDGVGIANVQLNSDYTLTITLTDGRTYTTTSIRGEQGETGLTPDFTIGTVTTLAPGSQATATITGTDEEPVLNLGIPKGDPGEVSLETLAKVMVSDTASGTIASFSDGSDALPAKSVLVTLTPKQSGSGTPSPSNVRPISGWDEVEVVVSSTQSADNATTYTTDLPQTVYGGTLDVVSGVLTVDRVSIDLTQGMSGGTISGNYLYFTQVPNAKTVPNSQIANVISEGYEPIRYNGVATNAGTIAIRDNNYLYVNTGGQENAPTGKAVYELATPTTIQCDPQTVQTLIGDNNVWGGDGVSIDYYADTKLYIEKMLGA